MIEAPAGMSLNEVRALQDWVIKPSLRITPGIADVVSFGGTIKEYQVRINPYLLKKYAIPIEQVNTALANNSNSSGGGLLRRGEESLVIRGIGLFRSMDDIGQVAVASRGGRPILVSDVAEQLLVGSRPRSGIVSYNDHDDIVEGIVQMTKGGNAAKVVAALKTRVDEVNARLPQGVRIVPFYERTDLIHHTVQTVTENLLLGAALVIAILVLFLRNWRTALIVASVIPLSLLFAFVLMDARGVSANLISLGAIDFGIIIDSAVVLVEALMVKIALAEREHNPLHSGFAWRMHALKATAVELGHPILFSKAIIILAFMPIFTFQRVEGKIFAPMAYTLSFALLGAILLTLTLVPTLLSFTMKSEAMVEKESRWLRVLQERYRGALAWSMQRRGRVIAASVLVLGAALGAAPYLGTEFLPKLDEGNIWLTISLPPSTALEQTKDLEREVRKILRGYPEVRQVVSQVGRPDDGTDPKGPNNLEVLADLVPRSDWRFADKDALVTDMSARIRSIPGVPTNFSQVIQDNVEEALSGAKGEIVVKVFGPDLEILQAKADQIARILDGVGGAADVGAFRIGGQSEAAIRGASSPRRSARSTSRCACPRATT
jgi:cobalt-zinc-cadmium resistance protein CzcA